MATINLGKVGIVPRGDWSAGTGNYEYLDVVSYLGGSYLVAYRNGNVPAGTLPTNKAYFQELTKPGDKGDKGNPFVYTDFTPAQLADLTNNHLAYINYMLGISQDETGTILSYAATMGYKKPSQQYISKLDSFIRDLKSSGLWGKMDLAYWMVGDGDMNFKTINIVNPAVSGTPVGGLSSSLQGISGNGIDGYIDTNYNSSKAVKQQAADASIALFVERSGNRIASNITGSAATSINNSQYTGNRLNLAGNSSAPGPDMSGVGFKVLTRMGSSLTSYNNGIAVESPSAGNYIIPSQNIAIFGGVAGYGTTGLSMFSIGSSLSAQDSANLRQAILNNL